MFAKRPGKSGESFKEDKDSILEHILEDSDELKQKMIESKREK